MLKNRKVALFLSPQKVGQAGNFWTLLRISAAPTGQILMKSDTADSLKYVEKIRVQLKSGNMSGTLHDDLSTFKLLLVALSRQNSAFLQRNDVMRYKHYTNAPLRCVVCALPVLSTLDLRPNEGIMWMFSRHRRYVLSKLVGLHVT